MIEKKEELKVLLTAEQADTQIRSALEMLDAFVSDSHTKMAKHVKELSDLQKNLKITAYNIAKMPDMIQENTRSCVADEYEKLLPKIREDFKRECRENAAFVSEQTEKLQSTLEKGFSVHKVVLRNLLLVGIVSVLCSIGGTWGALKLFKAHTSITTAQNVTSSGPIHLFDVSGRHISSVLENKKK